MPRTALPTPSKRGALVSRERAPGLASSRWAWTQRTKWGSHERRGGREVPGSPPHLPPHRRKHILNKSWAWINKCVRRLEGRPAPPRGGGGAALRQEGWRPRPPQTLAHQAAGEENNLTFLIFPPALLKAPPGRLPEPPAPCPPRQPGFPAVGTHQRARAAPRCLQMEVGGTQASGPHAGSGQAPLGAACGGGSMRVPPQQCRHRSRFRCRAKLPALPERPESESTAPRWLCPSTARPDVGSEREKQIPGCRQGLAEG